MNVTLNGEPYPLDQQTTLAELAERMGVRGRYAIEVNGKIVPKSTHASHYVCDGDVIEIVQAIGGG